MLRRAATPRGSPQQMTPLPPGFPAKAICPTGPVFRRSPPHVTTLRATGQSGSPGRPRDRRFPPTDLRRLTSRLAPPAQREGTLASSLFRHLLASTARLL